MRVSTPRAATKREYVVVSAAGESGAEDTASAAVAEWLDAAGLSDLAHAAGLDFARTGDRA